VKTHIGSLLAKRAARDRAQLVIAAYENGLAHSQPRPGARDSRAASTTTDAKH